MTGPPLTLHNQLDKSTLEFNPRQLVIAGYTGRDRGNVQRHIDELAEYGIAPPQSVPAFWDLPVDLLTQGGVIGVTSAESSGEVEPVLFGMDGHFYIGLGSDHTARDLERQSILASKASCGKPIGREVFPLDELNDDWDRLSLRSYAD
jgi:4-hydroxyphenylacetate 3-monooxygenase